MATDMHCHILPGIDDGSKSMRETEKMLRMAFSEGIDCIVATPHFSCNMSRELLKKRDEVYLSVKGLMKKMNPEAKIYLGNEIFYSSDAVNALVGGYARTINGTKYVLVEFDESADFPFIEKACQSLFYAGYWPILAHIDRFLGTRKMENVEKLVSEQVLMQVNTDAYMGEDGWRTRHYILKLMKHGLIHILGTDAHSCRHRRPQMKECLNDIEKRFGQDYAWVLSAGNPAKIIEGEHLYGKVDINRR